MNILIDFIKLIAVVLLPLIIVSVIYTMDTHSKS